MALASSIEFLDTQVNYRVWIFTILYESGCIVLVNITVQVLDSFLVLLGKEGDILKEKMQAYYVQRSSKNKSKLT